MSKIAFCPRGGQSGILVTTEELTAFARKLGKRSLTDVIPIPDLPFEQQETRMREDEPASGPKRHDEHSWQYWEVVDSGSHGWCCSYCGIVLQWG